MSEVKKQLQRLIRRQIKILGKNVIVENVRKKEQPKQYVRTGNSKT